MDRALIENEQLVERYLLGKLTLKEAQDFEGYCLAHPGLLEEMQFAERVNAGMRLLDRSDKPQDYREPPPPWWARWETTAAAGVLCLTLAITLWVLNEKYLRRGYELAAAQHNVQEGPIKPTPSTESIKLAPGRQGPGSAPATTLYLSNPPSLLEIHLDMAYTKQSSFDITLDKKDHTRVGTIYRLQRDSNGEVRFAINSSALRAGDYLATIEGVPFMGSPVPVGWLTVNISQ